MNTNIKKYVKDLSNCSRLVDTASCYMSSLAVPSDKHTQAFASLESGKDDSLFSSLLNHPPDETKITLNRSSKRRLKKLVRIANCFENGVEWKIALIIDATLHTRTSKHTNNVQKFNHGQGFVLGHQWTNIGFFVAGKFVPLPPIPFYTKEECESRGIPYQTEHEKVADFLISNHKCNFLVINYH